jgi:hypothetical protein
LLSVLVSASAALTAACGDGDEVDMGKDSSSGTGGATLGSGGGTGSGSTPGSSGSGDGGGALDPVNTCGASPCANHTGSHSFVDDSAPSDAADTFADATSHAAGTDPEKEPAIVYPSHETMFPINVSRIRHEWSAGENTLFELRFVGPNTDVTVYTAQADWLPDDAQWDWIAESNRGASVELTVRGLDAAAPDDAWSSEPITLLFSESEVEGAIYYWSTGTQGIMKALVSDPVPVKFYTDPAAEDSNTCVACHTLSRDGKRLAVGYGGEKLREVTVPDLERLVPTDDQLADGGAAEEPAMPPPGGMKPAPGGAEGGGRASAWTTFSPDGELLLVAANGTLTLIDSDTGETVGDDDGVVPLPEGTVATHPDWSAKGRVAITLGTKGGNKEVEGGKIALLDYTDGAWSTPEILVDNAGGEDNNFFPVWSPDSQYIAFVNAQGKSKDAVSALLRLVKVDDGQVTELVRLNERVNDEDGVTGIGNSMPTWAPSTQKGTFWLAFSSLRAYGSVRPQDDKEDQIWIAAIETENPDPSYAAFWAPFQSIEDGNHRAFWTHSDADKQCLCQDICGDDLDNDCDGTADEDGCIEECTETEICGDGIDNDCDCVVDDCNSEICNDGVDNDGDGLADTDDPSCPRIK